MQSLPPDQAQSDSPDINSRVAQLSVENNNNNTLDDVNIDNDPIPEQRPQSPLEPIEPPRRPSNPSADIPARCEGQPSLQQQTVDSEHGGRSSSHTPRRDILAEADGPVSPIRSTGRGFTRPQDQLHGQLSAENGLRSTGNWSDKGQSLPADDGMRILRQRIHAIRESNAPSAEKAQRIHALMTEKYRSSLKVPDSPQGVHHERPLTPLSPQSKRSSDQLTLTPASTFSSSSSTSGRHFHLSLDDLTPTYVPNVAPPTPSYGDEDLMLSGKTDNSPISQVQQVLGCQHYKRNVKLQCFTCKGWYTCRFCHDAVEDHSLIRHETENMLCMVCRTPQQASQWYLHRMLANQARNQSSMHRALHPV
ncbi:conserved hypothetical protein [Uncinocarpus reesii 1704]|uniref:CHY-type domain-containing protein n=1 Tax=Uncinocarpus reesii (strain UAMH 1704) TaxID=336963 RepID=C4JTC5_UNCRE|nr:uncharacterized protein UREG_05714 [Uncinocarpus reesii 1704]EEP80872.1 conserved hypothetical protein [Uncinocarpus reesii 1704]